MSKTKFDPAKVTVRWGVPYFDGHKIGSHRQRLYNKWVKNQSGATSSRLSFPKQYGKYFSNGSKFTNRQGHLENWARPMTVRGGANPNYNWGRVHYVDSKSVHLTSSNQKWGTVTNQVKAGSPNGSCVLIGLKGWLRQLQISIYALGVQSEHFRIVAGRRALKVFQNSFKYKQFYDQGSPKWPSLSPFTILKRAHRGTGSSILKEYGDLYNFIKAKEEGDRFRIYTDIVRANAAHHKKISVCYAGYHNEGVGTYGKGFGGRQPKPYVQRQFIGHSSHLDPYSNPFMRKMVKLYLFDSVFLVKKF